NDYSFTYVDGTLTVSKAHLTVTADDKNKTYGAATPALTSTITGFVNSEVLGTSGVTGSAAPSTAADTVSHVGTYPLASAAGGIDNDYNFSYLDGSLFVVPIAASDLPSGLQQEMTGQRYLQPKPEKTPGGKSSPIIYCVSMSGIPFAGNNCNSGTGNTVPPE